MDVVYDFINAFDRAGKAGAEDREKVQRSGKDAPLLGAEATDAADPESTSERSDAA